ncbi:MAG: DsbA family protein [Pseudomonadota bacterium]
MLMTRLLTLTALLTGLTLAAPAAALDLDAMSEEESAAFGEAVRSYLLENPQVLMEAIAILEERQAMEAAATDAQLVARNAAALFASPLDWVGGNPEGDITVVEFIDYRCGFCRRAAPELAELMEADDNIRLVVKEFPILGEASTMSSRFALAGRLVEGDAAYDALHEALTVLRPEPSEAILVTLADDLGLDGAAIWAEMENPEVTAVIEANYELARSMQISGTPTFVFGDQLVRGFIETEQMEELIEMARRR